MASVRSNEDGSSVAHAKKKVPQVLDLLPGYVPPKSPYDCRLTHVFSCCGTVSGAVRQRRGSSSNLINLDAQISAAPEITGELFPTMRKINAPPSGFLCAFQVSPRDHQADQKPTTGLCGAKTPVEMRQRGTQLPGGGGEGGELHVRLPE